MPPSTHTKRVRGGLVVSNNSTTAIAVHPENLPAEQDLQDADLKFLMDSAVTEDDWLDIFRKAKEMALGGGQVGVKAMEFLAKYRWGLPSQMTSLVTGEQAKITVIEVIRPEKQVVPNPQLDEGVPSTQSTQEQTENTPYVPF